MKALLKNSILMMILIAVTAVTGCAGKSGGGSGLFSSNKFQLRPFREVTLKNGLKVILIEDQSLPYLSLGMLVRVGSRQDPAGASGLTDMVAELMDKGTRKHTALELSDQLAQYGGEFNAAASKDATYVAASSLSFHQDQLLKHFAEILTEASFSNLEIERLRKRKLAQLRQLADDPESVTELALDTYLYPNHPYSKPVSGMIREVRMLSKK
ncbi:MAG: M16 family metallopeptidase, partial [Bdellovibrionales bacterium]